MNFPTNFSEKSAQSQYQSCVERLLHPLSRWLDGIEVHNPQLARWLCQLIPAQCPFARKILLFGQTLCQIPPLCKLNPLYNHLMALRFRALVFLANTCGEDVTKYC
jgi:Mo-dependent nitrogenase C-terminus